MGCGWLGLPLAEHIISLSYTVKGSTTSKARLAELHSKKVDPFLICVLEEEITGDLKFFEHLDTLIIAMPPGLRSNPNRRFDLMINQVKKVCVSYGVKEVIFISSTSVYGKSTGVITEKNKPMPVTNSGKQLLLCETLLKETPNFSTTILRMGGLINEKRHPVVQLSKKAFVTNPDGSVNLIHLTDCVHILTDLLINEISGNVYNCVTPYHPSRKKYYTKIAAQIGCKPPEFVASELFDRRISSQKLMLDLNYNFKIKNLLISS